MRTSVFLSEELKSEGESKQAENEGDRVNSDGVCGKNEDKVEVPLFYRERQLSH